MWFPSNEDLQRYFKNFPRKKEHYEYNKSALSDLCKPRIYDQSSYCLSDRWKSVMLRFWAPHHSTLCGHPPISGSSKGLESPRKKCSRGTARSHSGLDFHASFINWLQRFSMAVAANLKKQVRTSRHLRTFAPKTLLRSDFFKLLLQLDNHQIVSERPKISLAERYL